MPEIAHVDLKSALEVAHTTPTLQAPNGIRYGSYGETQLSGPELESIVHAVPRAIAAALGRKSYYFVPLVLGELAEDESRDDTLVQESGPIPQAAPDKIMVAAEFSSELSDAALCHRDATFDGMECVLISTRLLEDRFALAFEFYINAARHFVAVAGVPEGFMNLLWSQAEAGVRGETSHDAWEHRARALGRTGMESAEGAWSAPRPRPRRNRASRSSTALASASDATHGPSAHPAIDERERTEYFDAAFADAIAIYLLSLTVDFDYTELREREYPLLAASALAARLRSVAELFPPNPGQEFSIHYRRRNG